tara:strand:- start:9556 stop:10071 length:516 start_codon:yes stop_codon:yes gene_type:complete
MGRRSINLLRTLEGGMDVQQPLRVPGGAGISTNSFEVTGNVALSGATILASAFTASTSTAEHAPDVTNASVLWISCSLAHHNIEGFKGGKDGQVLHVCKTGAVGHNLTFKHLDLAGGTAAGASIVCPEGINIKLDTDSTAGGIICVYRAHSATENDGKWMVIASGGCQSGY